jgi:hypothetical protein
MHQDDCARSGNNGGTEHFTGMHKDCVERADGNQMMSLDTSARIEHKSYETFAFRVEVQRRLNVQPPVLGRMFRPLTYPQCIRRRTFAERNHFVFARLFALHD